MGTEQCRPGIRRRDDLSAGQIEVPGLVAVSVFDVETMAPVPTPLLEKHHQVLGRRHVGGGRRRRRGQCSRQQVGVEMGEDSFDRSRLENGGLGQRPRLHILTVEDVHSLDD